MAGSRQFDTEKALESAMETFRTKGFSATSMSDLESATGLGRGSIYNAFGDKQALFTAVLDHYAAQMEGRLRGMLDGGPNALEGVRLVVRMAAVECSGDQHGCLMGKAASERVSCDDAAQAVVERCFAETVEIFTEHLRQAQIEGDFDSQRDPEATARFLVMCMQGMNLMSQTARPELLSGIAEEILRVLD